MNTIDLTADEAAEVAATIDPTEAAVARFRAALTAPGPAFGLGPLERTIVVRAVIERVFPGAGIRVRLSDLDPRHANREDGHGTLVDVTDGPAVEAVEAALATHLDGVGGRPTNEASAGWIHVRRWLSPGTFAALMIHECQRSKGRDQLLVPTQEPNLTYWRHRSVNTPLIRQAVRDLAMGPAIGPGLPGRPQRASAEEWEQLQRVGPALAALAGLTRPVPALGFAAAARERDNAAIDVIRIWRSTSMKALELLIPDAQPVTTPAPAVTSTTTAA